MPQFGQVGADGRMGAGLAPEKMQAGSRSISARRSWTLCGGASRSKRESRDRFLKPSLFETSEAEILLSECRVGAGVGSPAYCTAR
jgi:hypothetical protein